MASLFHPLCGSNPPTLLKLFWENGLPARDRYPQAALALAVSLARWPFSTAEQAVFALSPKSPMPDPIFIVGYWRSGTTHLHNVMAQYPAFGYITPLATGMPWDILGIVRSLEPLLEQALPQDRYVDNVAVTPTSPQ
ncbi:MAG: sulfotransferase, partial [Cyanobacteria bacterium J06638_6]